MAHSVIGHDLRVRLVRRRDRTSVAVQQALASSAATRSAIAAGREQAVLLADAVARLPADYREVFVLRNLEHLLLDEVAARMHRPPSAARVLTRLGETWNRNGCPGRFGVTF